MPDSSRAVVTRSCDRRRAVSAACSSATICASSSAARFSSASVSPDGRGVDAAGAAGAGSVAGRRTIGLRWPGRVLPRTRFAMTGWVTSLERRAGGHGAVGGRGYTGPSAAVAGGE